MDFTATDTAEMIGVSVRSVNSIYLKIRCRLAESCESASPLQGAVEVDESYFGARRVRGKRGRGAYGKTIVFGVLKREGKVYTEIVPKDYTGEPLVSFEAELAEKLDLKIGDQVTVNVLGRNLTARIANLRDVKWESLALNFVMVFSPNALAQAPHATLATVTLPKSTPLGREVHMARALGQAFPAVTPIRVKDAIEAFNGVFAKIMTAVRVAGGVTLLSGALVLAGALATAQRKRILEAVILKTLGATRKRIVAAHLAEYLILAAVTAVFAVILGGLAAWIAVAKVMEIEFVLSWPAIGQTLLLATALVSLFGGIGTWAVLRARPVPYLRTE